MNEYADNTDDEEDGISVSSSNRSPMDSEGLLDEEEKANMKYEPVKARINGKGDIYYITSYEG
jgi:hypothetical protein